MKEIKLNSFIELANGKNYCIVHQQMIGDRHFAYVMTVPDKIDSIPEAEPAILEFILAENGQIIGREINESEEDYQEIVKHLAELYEK